MDYLVICIAALLGSGLTLFSGFGLGTILVPVFALFFPIDLAIVLTAIVHFLNNGFKLALLGKHADKKIVLRFGIPAIVAAFAGAFVLTLLSDIQPLKSYELFGRAHSITPVNLIIGLLLIAFALIELIPRFSQLQIHPRHLPLGGLLSGFFGGLSGNQGALRSMFLLRTTLTKEAFVATGVVIACLIDISRLIVYTPEILTKSGRMDYQLIICATLSAFAGAYIGNKILKKITVRALRNTVAALLILFGVVLCFGLI